MLPSDAKIAIVFQGRLVTVQQLTLCASESFPDQEERFGVGSIRYYRKQSTAGTLVFPHPADAHLLFATIGCEISADQNGLGPHSGERAKKIPVLAISQRRC